MYLTRNDTSCLVLMLFKKSHAILHVFCCHFASVIFINKTFLSFCNDDYNYCYRTGNVSLLFSLAFSHLFISSRLSVMSVMKFTINIAIKSISFQNCYQLLQIWHLLLLNNVVKIPYITYLRTGQSVIKNILAYLKV